MSRGASLGGEQDRPLDRSLMQRLDLVSLHIFVSTCEEGSLARAAARERLAVSALSKRIADLEAHLGVRLFDRQARGMRLTPPGVALLHHAREILSGVRLLDRKIAEFRSGARGDVRVIASLSALVQFLPEDLARFRVEHSQIRIATHETTSQQVVNGILNGEGDVGVCCLTDPVEGLDAAIYRYDHLVAAMPGHHPLAGRESIGFAELIDYDHVGLHPSCTISALMKEAASTLNRDLRIAIRVPSFDAQCRMVAAGLGVGVMPNGAFYQLGFDRNLCALPLVDGWARRRLYVVTKSGGRLEGAGRLLAAYLGTARGDPLDPGSITAKPHVGLSVSQARAPSSSGDEPRYDERWIGSGAPQPQ